MFELRLPAGEELAKFKPEATEEAIGLIQREIELDPTGSRAYGDLAYVYQQQVDNGRAPHDAAMARRLDAASRAVQLDPTNTWVRYLLAQRYLCTNEMRRWWADNQHRDDLPPYRANGPMPQQIRDAYQQATTPQP